MMIMMMMRCLGIVVLGFLTVATDARHYALRQPEGRLDWYHNDQPNYYEPSIVRRLKKGKRGSDSNEGNKGSSNTSSSSIDGKKGKRNSCKNGKKGKRNSDSSDDCDDDRSGGGGGDDDDDDDDDGGGGGGNGNITELPSMQPEPTTIPTATPAPSTSLAPTPTNVLTSFPSVTPSAQGNNQGPVAPVAVVAPVAPPVAVVAPIANPASSPVAPIAPIAPVAPPVVPDSGIEVEELAVRIRDGNEENTISLLQTQFIEGSLGLEVRVRNNPESPPPPAKKNSNEGPEPGTVTEGGIVDTPNDARISGAALLFEIKQEQTPVEPEVSGVRSGIMQGMMTKREQDKESNEIPKKTQSTGRNHHDHKST